MSTYHAIKKRVRVAYWYDSTLRKHCAMAWVADGQNFTVTASAGQVIRKVVIDSLTRSYGFSWVFVVEHDLGQQVNLTPRDVSRLIEFSAKETA